MYKIPNIRTRMRFSRDRSVFETISLALSNASLPDATSSAVSRSDTIEIYSFSNSQGEIKGYNFSINFEKALHIPYEDCFITIFNQPENERGFSKTLSQILKRKEVDVNGNIVDANYTDRIIVDIDYSDNGGLTWSRLWYGNVYYSDKNVVLGETSLELQCSSYVSSLLPVTFNFDVGTSLSVIFKKIESDLKLTKKIIGTEKFANIKIDTKIVETGNYLDLIRKLVKKYRFHYVVNNGEHRVIPFVNNTTNRISEYRDNTGRELIISEDNYLIEIPNQVGWSLWEMKLSFNNIFRTATWVKVRSKAFGFDLLGKENVLTLYITRLTYDWNNDNPINLMKCSEIELGRSENDHFSILSN